VVLHGFQGRGSKTRRVGSNLLPLHISATGAILSNGSQREIVRSATKSGHASEQCLRLLMTLSSGRQIVPSDWVKRVTTPVVAIDRSRSYGYQWYMGDLTLGTPPAPHHWVGGIGWGGQRLYVLPALDLVVAMNCGNYRKSGMEQSRIALALLAEIVGPIADLPRRR
jgi:hypothetical protein